MEYIILFTLSHKAYPSHKYSSHHHYFMITIKMHNCSQSSLTSPSHLPQVYQIREEATLHEQSKGKTKEGANDPVTDGDIKSHMAMFNSIKNAFPGVEVGVALYYYYCCCLYSYPYTCSYSHFYSYAFSYSNIILIPQSFSVCLTLTVFHTFSLTLSPLLHMYIYIHNR